MSITAFTSLEQLPPDALFDVKKRLSKDERPFKVDLGIGAYRNEEGKPWILPSVREAEKAVQEASSYNHEYLNISGLPSFTTGAARILFGEDSEAMAEGRVISLQSLSGTGALHIASRILLKTVPDAVVYLSDPTWANHKSIFETQGFKTVTYPYWNARTKSLDINGFLQAIEEAPRGSVFVVHTCAHNPTGTDPTQKQWGQLIDKFVAGEHIVLFDTAYQGFATGDLAADAFSLRLGVEKLASVSPILVCQSFAKNAGMYGERVGAFHVVMPRLSDREEESKVNSSLLSQLNLIARSEYSNPPAYGAKIVDRLLNTPALFKKWHEDMKTMSSRIMEMRHTLRDRLVQLGTPGNWDHIVEQCGMFSYTGLTSEMVERLEKEHAVYMVSSGRASIAGLNEGNVNHVAASIDSVVRYFSQPRL